MQDSGAELTPIRFRSGRLELLDQTKLPGKEDWLECESVEEVAVAIQRLAVRGAPAIGVSAAYGLILGVQDADDEDLQAAFDASFDILGASRPTAVNLRWALEQGREVFDRHISQGREALLAALGDWARGVQEADVEANRRIGVNGAGLFSEDDRVLTHCNTGALATAGYGTALGVIRAAWEKGRVSRVWADETRPLLQGARLTAWELERLGIPYRLIVDSAAGSLMANDEVDRIVVGADRIAANGDTANKIGTYSLAVLAARHEVPFYIAAPVSTIDPATATGKDIPIEERDPEEIRNIFGAQVAPEDAPALNLAFDVTPAELITAIITDAGILHPPYTESIAKIL